MSVTVNTDQELQDALKGRHHVIVAGNGEMRDKLDKLETKTQDYKWGIMGVLIGMSATNMWNYSRHDDMGLVAFYAVILVLSVGVMVYRIQRNRNRKYKVTKFVHNNGSAEYCIVYKD